MGYPLAIDVYDTDQRYPIATVYYHWKGDLEPALESLYQLWAYIDHFGFKHLKHSVLAAAQELGGGLTGGLKGFEAQMVKRHMYLPFPLKDGRECLVAFGNDARQSMHSLADSRIKLIINGDRSYANCDEVQDTRYYPDVYTRHMSYDEVLSFYRHVKEENHANLTDSKF